MKAAYKSKVTEMEHNCNECFFQGTSKTELEKHINLKHTREEFVRGSTIKCYICGEQFNTKANLMYHRKSKHTRTVAFCRNKLDENCPYADNMCWWKHDGEMNEIIECYNCDKTFETRTDMMNHRKTDHKSIIKYCSRFKDGNCRFKSEACWFQHEERNDHSRTESNQTQEKETNKDSEQVFQKASKNLKPPEMEKRM